MSLCKCWRFTSSLEEEGPECQGTQIGFDSPCIVCHEGQTPIENKYCFLFTINQEQRGKEKKQ